MRQDASPEGNDCGDVRSDAAVTDTIGHALPPEESAALRRALSGQRVLLEEIVARVPVGVALLWGPEHRFTLANDRYLDLLPPNRAEVVGRTVAEVLPEAANVFPLLDRVFRTGDRVEEEDFPLPFGGERAWLGNRYYTFSYDPIHDGDGSITGVLVAAVETTTRVRREHELTAELDAEHEVAGTLQRALLPATLPTIPGAQLAAVYRAAGAYSEVGGDFYDAFDNRDGSWTIVVGDLCGKGPHAAAQTAMARYTLRAYAADDNDPARLLTRLNEEMLHHAPDGPAGAFCTAICARLTVTADGSIAATLARGGHPPPLVLGHDRDAVVEIRGTLVGAFPDCDFETTTLQLGPGESMVFYTDGALEARAPGRTLTPEELASAIPAERRDDPTAVALSVERAALGGGTQQRDDIAVLVVTVDGRT